jgi:sugar lactone lactonase YvrE
MAALLSAAPAAIAQPAPAALRIVREIPDSTFWPEAVDFDPRTRSWFVSSIRRGTILRIDSLGHAVAFAVGVELRGGAAMGLRVDAERRVLWATWSGLPQREGYAPADSAVATILEIGIDDGRTRRQWNLPPAPGGHVLGDLAIGPNGDVFFTDSRQPELYRLRPGRDSLETIRDTLFKSLQGVAPTPDGRALFLADYSRGLLRLDLQNGRVTRVTTSDGKLLRGCDGLVWYRGGLLAIHNGVLPGHVIRVALDATGGAIGSTDLIEVDPAVGDEPTVGTIVGDELVFVGTSQWEKHDNVGRLLPNAKLRPIVLVGMKLQ